MFYSHQLLARKAPLGQIWMAATMHAKLNRRKLDKLNIIKICAEILNPSVPMALRLSGILMGGVVIVYNKKVKLLYDDVNSLLVEINEAWRVKKPKKTKYDAVTLPTNNVVEMDIDQSIPMTNTTATARVRFRNQDSRMQLDELEDEYIQINYNDSSPSIHQHHQADPQNITIMDEMDLFLPTENDLYNRFETFDIFGDDEEIQITQDQRRDVFTINPTPPSQKEDELVPDHHMEEPQKDQMANETKSEAHESQDAPKDEHKQRLGPRRANRKVNTFIMDNDHLILPGSVYQTWIQDTSNILKNKRRKIKQPNPILAGKIANIMEIPPAILHSYIEIFPSEICYPAPLILQWIEITKPDIDSNSSSGERMDRQEQDPTVHSPPPNFPQDYPGFPGENFNTDIDFTSLPENMRELNFQKDSFFNTGNSVKSTVDASNPKVRSGPSTLPMFSPSNFNSGRSSQKNQYSSPGNSLSNLDPLEDGFPTFLETVLEDTDFELREEAGTTTQTPHVVPMDKPIDVITQHFKTHLNTHFMKEGAPLSESLDWLSSGLNRRSAAQLFHQTCVLANADYINVNQEVAYGEIFISKGPKM